MRTLRRVPWGRAALIAVCVATASCRGVPEPALTRAYEARRLVAEVRTQLAKAVGASDRAVMADTDEASTVFAREARAAMQTVERDAVQLTAILHDLNYDAEARLAETFRGQLAAYRKMDDGVLAMAVENTNVKAQRLSFGPERQAADRVEAALRAAASAAPAKSRAGAEALALEAALAVRHIQVLEAPHIAEADDTAMDRLEVEIAALDAAARKAIASLAEVVPAAGLAPAQQAFGQFGQLSRLVVSLSRRNTNVRSVALSLRQKPALTSACELTLASLDEALTKAIVGPTR